MNAAAAERRLVRDYQAVRINQRWQSRATGVVIIVRQIHRADRCVEAVYAVPRPTITFATLATEYELLGGAR